MTREQFSQRAVIITGGAGGVGRFVTRRWLESGASVLVADHSEATIESLKKDLSDHQFEAVASDVTTEEGANRIVEAAESAFGKSPDTLIHLVGGFAMGALDAPDAPLNWARMMALNLTSAFQCYRAVVPPMRSRGGGWIVGLGSRAATEPGAKMAAYAASKSGLAALTKSLSEEVKSVGIHVNLILASTIDTPANRRDMGEKNAGKWVSPGDIAEATLYLCSERANAAHGSTLELFGTV